MNDVAQSTAAALIVTVALMYIAMRAWRAIQAARARKAGSCGPHCGCD